MTATPDLILKLIKKCDVSVKLLDSEQKQLAAFIATNLRRIEHVQEAIADARKLECKENEDHRRRLESIRGMKTAARKDCPHLNTTYYPDASGGSDSETICDDCGAEIPKR